MRNNNNAENNKSPTLSVISKITTRRKHREKEKEATDVPSGEKKVNEPEETTMEAPLPPKTSEQKMPTTSIRTRTMHRNDQNLPQGEMEKPQQPRETFTNTAEMERELDEMPLLDREIILRLQNTHLSGGEFPLPDSEEWTARGEWSNINIDSVTNAWATIDTTVNVLPAKFIVEAQRNPRLATENLQRIVQESPGTILMILWIRHHWIAATIRETVMEIADSAPGIATQTDLRSIADFIGLAINKQLTIVMMRNPHQPKNSVECGAHTVVNLILSHARYLWPREAGDNNVERVSYDGMQEALRLFTEGELRLDFIKNRILEIIGDARCPLITHQRMIKIADNWTQGKMHIRWMGATQMHSWNGTLVKKKPTHWQIRYDEDDGLGVLPHKNVCYLTVEPSKDEDEWNMNHTHGDLLCLNCETPPSTAKVEGDSITMKRLKELLPGEPGVPNNEFFIKAYAPTTRKHQRQLLGMIQQAPNKYETLPATTAIIRLVLEMKHQRKWRCSTTLTKMACIQGTLKILPYYYPTSPSILLSQSVQWKTSMRGAQIAANAEQPNQAKPATSDDIQRTLATITDNLQLHAALELAWLTAGRIGDILSLQPAHICVVEEKVMVVKFMTGKTARNGHYSIAIPMPGERTTRFLTTCRTPYLFPSVRQDMVRDALRSTDMLLECRSIRRGRLQELSRGGMTDSSLLHISRHAEISMLRRYLDYGLASGENLRRAAMAAEATATAIASARSNARTSGLQNFSRGAEREDAPHPRTSSVPSPPSPPSSEDSFR